MLTAVLYSPYATFTVFSHTAKTLKNPKTRQDVIINDIEKKYSFLFCFFIIQLPIVLIIAFARRSAEYSASENALASVPISISIDPVVRGSL